MPIGRLKEERKARSSYKKNHRHNNFSTSQERYFLGEILLGHARLGCGSVLAWGTVTVGGFTPTFTTTRVHHHHHTSEYLWWFHSQYTVQGDWSINIKKIFKNSSHDKSQECRLPSSLQDIFLAMRYSASQKTTETNKKNYKYTCTKLSTIIMNTCTKKGKTMYLTMTLHYWQPQWWRLQTDHQVSSMKAKLFPKNVGHAMPSETNGREEFLATSQEWPVTSAWHMTPVMPE